MLDVTKLIDSELAFIYFHLNLEGATRYMKDDVLRDGNVLYERISVEFRKRGLSRRDFYTDWAE